MTPMMVTGGVMGKATRASMTAPPCFSVAAVTRSFRIVATVAEGSKYSS